MVSDELKRLLIQVITSWQVIAVTVVLVLYFLLLFYAARTYRRRRSSATPTTKASKSKAPAPIGEPDVVTTDDDDLGLEEG
ncbi:hypothetical protein AGMMS50268_21600 [Spirochaetia bacterium]|nr:hypothetical protein AGMMS49546_38080 [Spirochaetia bacterium]GHV91657.1 hypothetical protein AGMMS50268_21600 [Spirochaetia bacterium]